MTGRGVVGVHNRPPHLTAPSLVREKAGQGNFAMKVFWSWQSDTPGKTGRHFVRGALNEAIDVLKQAAAIEEPTERELREAIHLDQDRQGVPGSPDLAPTIYKKIESAAVFVADVTLVAESGADGRRKKFINSNVAIEYGYALHALTDAFVLTIQNTHYGTREELPFDLKHKAGPIQFRLSPDAKKAEIDAERAKLKGVLAEAIKLCLANKNTASGNAVKFDETASTANPAFFWDKSEVIAHYGSSPLARLTGLGNEDDDGMDFRFNEPRAFYLRLIPTAPLPKQLDVTALNDVVQARKAHVLSTTIGGAMPARNRFGAIAYEPHGTATTPIGFTQLFRNGEIWGVTSIFFVHHQGKFVIPTGSVETVFDRVLGGYISVALDDFKIPTPYQVEIGAVGLNGVCVSLPREQMQWANQVSEPIYESQLVLRKVLNDTTAAARRAVINEFLLKIYDLAGVSIPQSP